VVHIGTTVIWVEDWAELICTSGHKRLLISYNRSSKLRISAVCLCLTVSIACSLPLRTKLQFPLT